MKSVDTKPLSDAPQLDPTILQNIKSEVTNETRPFLEFVLAKAKYIMTIVIVLIVALAGTGIWRYVMKSQQEKVQNAIARIEAGPSDASQLAKLEALLADSSDRLRPVIYVSLAKSALLQKNMQKAAEAYGFVARACADSSMGTAAALNEAGIQFKLGKYAEGVRILQGIKDRFPSGAAEQVEVMMAEGAVKAEQFDLAAKTYEKLIGSTNAGSMGAGFYASRASEIRAIASARKQEQAASSPSAKQAK